MEVEVLFEKEPVCISCTVGSSQEEIVSIDGTLRLIKRISVPYITWTPWPQENLKKVAVQYQRMIEIDLRDLKCFKRDQQKVGNRYSFIVFILADGTTYPPMYFKMGGTKSLQEAMREFLHISASEGHLHQVKMYDQNALVKSFDQLNLFNDRESSQMKAENFVLPYKSQPMINRLGTSALSLFRDALMGTNVPDGEMDIRHQIREDHDKFNLSIHALEDSDFQLITKSAECRLPPKPHVERLEPLNRDTLASFIDSEGRIIEVDTLKRKIFSGGMDYDCRNKLWKYLLGYFNWSATDEENEKTREIKAKEYFDMKFQWSSIKKEQERRFTKIKERKSLIDKDVHRTDRCNEFFKNRDDGNLEMLYDILMTYTMYNFDLGYVQGMNDLLAPILLIMKNESDAFWCFAGLMDKMEDNFKEDQIGMKKQFAQIHTLMFTLDPQFYNFFENTKSTEFFFLFRWLLVHFKREFNYSDIMRLWEVLWTGLPCHNFHLLVALAILDEEKITMIESRFGFTEILKHINDLAYQINVEEALTKAEAIWLQAKLCWDELPEDMREIVSYPSAAAESASEAVV